MSCSGVLQTTTNVYCLAIKDDDSKENIPVLDSGQTLEKTLQVEGSIGFNSLFIENGLIEVRI